MTYNVSTQIEIELLFDIILKELKISSEQLKSKNRSRPIVHARRIFIVILKEYTLNSLSQITSYISKNHATGSITIKKHKLEVEKYDDYGNKYRKIKCAFLSENNKDGNFVIRKILELKKTKLEIESEIISYERLYLDKLSKNE